MEYPISLISTISAPVKGKIIFATMKDEGTQTAQVLVFDMISNVLGRIPKEPIFKCESQIYQNKKVKLMIKNHF